MELNSLIWTIPGAISLFFYNFNRSDRVLPLTGWNYIIAIVVFSAINIGLSDWIIGICSFNESSFLSMFLASSFAIVLGLICSFIRFKFFPIKNLFLDQCYKWKGSAILLSMKNGKVYVGTLLTYSKYEKDEEKFIEITPMISGYREQEKKEVRWITKYPLEPVIILFIPQREIISISPWEDIAEFEDLES